ncbi:mannosyltransferase [Lonsdalea populi]|uniref:glycosyltransferase family 4 protein n=1 Tax=Lonsdalea populi TaxID=1172565 RepID=UPI000DCA5E89|nr:glycosyltransferase family 1 protein [Lonsdalea populi]RAT67508.1 mannosyltransferase [Lonsdalea populi]RAT71177.1 mannosyltransferase [Lonsdalea populi]RAT76880.1 mannosyltransferase [Lonsdalea populi]RAT79990.1 mannosyltransferase [Lonsdalea populi]
MHILIDLQSCQTESRLRGIGRYSLMLAKSIINNASGHKISLLLNGLYSNNLINTVKREFLDLVPEEDIYTFSAHGPIAGHAPENKGRNIAAKICRELAIANIGPDIVLNMGFTEGFWEHYISSFSTTPSTIRHFSIVYDLIPFLYPDKYLTSEEYKRFYMKMLAELQLADGVLAISESAAGEVKTHTQIEHSKVTNISSASSSNFEVIDISEENKKGLWKKYHIPSEYIMTIGIVESRKNIETLIQAYAALPAELKEKYVLLLACQIKPHDKEHLLGIAAKYDLPEHHIVFTGFIPDDDLVGLYNTCKLFVFPSIHEGFGLPPLEAMSCGAATIASNTSSLPEVMGWSESMFDPRDVDDMTRLMIRALTDSKFYQALRENALSQAKEFSWDKTARTALQAFEKSLSQHQIDRQQITPESAYQQALARIHDLTDKELNEVDRLGVAWAIARNCYQRHQKKLLVDISVLVEVDAATGIQRVVRSVLSNLLSLDIPGYKVKPVYCRLGGTFRYANNFVSEKFSIDCDKKDEPVLFTKGDILLGLDLTAHLFPYLVTQLEQIRNSGVQVYYVVYDIIPLMNPQWCSESIQAAFPVWIKSLAVHTDGLVCISKSVASEVQQWLSEHADRSEVNPYLKIKHFHLGADLSSSLPSTGRPSDSDEVLSKIRKRKTFLMVSTIEPRKGHAQVLAAFDNLWELGVDCNLVIVGKKGWDIDALINKITRHHQLNEKLFWLNGISDEFLSEIYANAHALIVASLAEGFGLPVIEAAQNGLPIISRDIPVLREVAADNALYFRGDEPEDIVVAIQEWMKMDKNGTTIQSTAIPWLTWKESTLQLLEQLPIAKLK